MFSRYNSARHQPFFAFIIHYLLYYTILILFTFLQDEIIQRSWNSKHIRKATPNTKVSIFFSIPEDWKNFKSKLFIYAFFLGFIPELASCLAPSAPPYSEIWKTFSAPDMSTIPKLFYSFKTLWKQLATDKLWKLQCYTNIIVNFQW